MNFSAGRRFVGDPQAVAIIIAAVIGAAAVIFAALIAAGWLEVSVGPDAPGASSASPVIRSPAGSARSSAAPSSTSTAEEPAVEIRHSTPDQEPLVLSASYYADLDSREPNWNVTYGGQAGDHFDFSYNHVDGLISGRVNDLGSVVGPVQYDTCKNFTGYGGNVIPVRDLEPGDKICVRTSDKRFALVTFEKFLKQQDQVQVAVTVWEPTSG